MVPRRALVILNPAADHGESSRRLAGLAELLSDAFPHDLVVTEGPHHARTLAEHASGYDVLIAAGGDGTVHEVLNGLMTKPAGERPAFAVLPTGSGNDYRRTLGISDDLAEAVGQVASGTRRRVDVGVCNGHYFANSVGIGLDARVTARAVELKETTTRTGLYLYLTALFHVLFREFRTHDVRLQFDEGPTERRGVLFVALTHGPTYGGGFHITPGAVGDDGLMDVCLIDAISLWQTLWRVPFAIPGKHTWMAPVHMSRADRVRIWSDEVLDGQIDGEIMAYDHYDVSVIPGGLEVVVPA